MTTQHTDALRWRKRPVVIIAYQTDQPLEIETREGTLTARAGDWIVTGTHGEVYPVDPVIFSGIYEPVDDVPLVDAGPLQFRSASVVPLLTLSPLQVTFLSMVAAERARQDARWGGPEHDRAHSRFQWLSILVACTANLRRALLAPPEQSGISVLRELAQVVAVGLAWGEREIERDQGAPGAG